jgi:hypothetical protein
VAWIKGWGHMIYVRKPIVFFNSGSKMVSLSHGTIVVLRSLNIQMSDLQNFSTSQKFNTTYPTAAQLPPPSIPLTYMYVPMIQYGVQFHLHLIVAAGSFRNVSYIIIVKGILCQQTLMTDIFNI